MQVRTPISLCATAVAVVTLAACANMGAPTMAPFSQMSLPDAVKVPAGHMVAMETAANASLHRVFKTLIRQPHRRKPVPSLHLIAEAVYRGDAGVRIADNIEIFPVRLMRFWFSFSRTP